MGMYDHLINGTSENIKIMGYPFYAEDIESDEPYNRRERNFTPIIGGTEEVTKGEYVHRSYSFTSMISYPPGKPNVYDTIFKKMEKGPVEVISKNMGGKFNAIITIRKSFPYPNRMQLNVSVTEIPSSKSLIPGESFTVPKTKKIKSKVKVSNKKSSDKKNTKKNSKSKSKNKTVTKKTKTRGK